MRLTIIWFVFFINFFGSVLPYFIGRTNENVIACYAFSNGIIGILLCIYILSYTMDDVVNLIDKK